MPLLIKLKQEINMTFKLETNLRKTEKKWLFKKEYFEDIPKTKGVYIVGIQKETEQGEKFCPLYVGTHTSNLASRIEGHWDKKNTETIRGSLNSFKEIFDLSLPPFQFYKGIKIWNNEWKGKRFRSPEKKIKQLVNFFNMVKDDGDNCLLWFPNETFFQIYLANSEIAFTPKLNHHELTLRPNNLYDVLLNEKKLINKINDTKSLIESKYWYYFIEVEDTNTKLEELESYINQSLIENYGVYTFAKSSSPKKEFLIDWTNIEDDIIRLK
jgi:hypothetical protein